MKKHTGQLSHWWHSRPKRFDLAMFAGFSFGIPALLVLALLARAYPVKDPVWYLGVAVVVLLSVNVMCRTFLKPQEPATKLPELRNTSVDRTGGKNVLMPAGILVVLLAVIYILIGLCSYFGDGMLEMAADEKYRQSQSEKAAERPSVKASER